MLMETGRNCFMKLLICNGSPREGGNTSLLAGQVVEGARSRGADAEVLVLNSLSYIPCQECDEIRDDGTCRVEDDMRIVYDKVKRADALVLASPVFFGSVSAQLKMMIDRYQCVWWVTHRRGKKMTSGTKPGAFIAVAASHREDFFHNARSVVKNFFATIGITYNRELFVPGVDEKGAVREKPEALQAAYRIGEELVNRSG